MFGARRLVSNEDREIFDGKRILELTDPVKWLTFVQRRLRRVRGNVTEGKTRYTKRLRAIEALFSLLSIDDTLR